MDDGRQTMVCRLYLLVGCFGKESVVCRQGYGRIICEVDYGQAQVGRIGLGWLEILAKQVEIEWISGVVMIVEMIAAVAADFGIGDAHGPGDGCAGFGIGHQRDGDAVLGVDLHCERARIVILGFPAVDGAHIGPAAVEVKPGGCGIAGKDECVVAIEILDDGREPVGIIGRCVEVWFEGEIEIACDEAFIGG